MTPAPAHQTPAGVALASESPWADTSERPHPPVASSLGVTLSNLPAPESPFREWAPRARLLCLGVGSAFFLVTGAAAVILDQPARAVAVALLGVILMLAGASKAILHRSRRPSTSDGEGGSGGALPQSHLATDRATPLGDTVEAHDEISPHDLPPDHPGRRAAERQAREHGGLTSGDTDLTAAWPIRSGS